MIKITFYLFILLINNSLAGTPAVLLEEEKDFYEIGLNLDILEDPTGELNINEVNRHEWSAKFKRNYQKFPNFGFTKSAFWARFSIKNKTNFQKKWLLSFNFYLQNEISFFKKKGRPLA